MKGSAPHRGKNLVPQVGLADAIQKARIEMETGSLEIRRGLIDKCHWRGNLRRCGALATPGPFPISGQRRKFLT
jgi:hypothetical protein